MSEILNVRKSDWEALLRAVHAVSENAVSEIVVTAPRPAPQETRDASGFFKDYGKFYDVLRGDKMLGPTISQSEFDGCDRIIRACGLGGWGVSWTAYALGTTYHEVSGTMQPIREHGGPAYFTRMYDIKGDRPSKARELGNLKPGDGARYFGRGYVQLTGLTNYARATQKLRELGFTVDLVANPDQALDPDIAAAILVAGMREGWFTGRDIDDDLPASGQASREQFIASRDIINGRDRQDLIAGYAMTFQTALTAGGYTG